MYEIIVIEKSTYKRIWGVDENTIMNYSNNPDYSIDANSRIPVIIKLNGSMEIIPIKDFDLNQMDIYNNSYKSKLNDNHIVYSYTEFWCDPRKVDG